MKEDDEAKADAGKKADAEAEADATATAEATAEKAEETKVETETEKAEATTEKAEETTEKAEETKAEATTEKAEEKAVAKAPVPAVRSPWIVRVGLLVAGLALGGFAAWWFFVREPALDVPRDLLAAVPARVDVVARLDLEALRRSRHVSELFAETDRRNGTLSRIRERCGFDPIEKVQELVVFATLDARGRTQDFAYIARGDLSRARSEACASAVAGGETGDGGGLRIERYKGRLVLAGATGDGRVAMLDDTHAVGGGVSLVHGVIDVLTSGAPSLTGAAPLSAVVRRIGDGQDFAAALLVAPATQRSLESSLPPALASLSKARSIGVSAALRDNRWRVGAVAQMGAPSSATTAIDALDAQVASLRRSPLIGLTVLGLVLSGVRLSAEGAEAIGTASASEDQIDEMVSLWRRFGRRRTAGGSALPPGLVPGLGDDAPPPPGPQRQRDAPTLERPTEERDGPRERPSDVHDRAQPERDPAGTGDPGSP